MGYYMRFVVSDEKKISLTELSSVLREVDEAYRIDSDGDTEGVLIYKDEVYGQIFVNEPSDGLFDDEISELIEFVEGVEGENKPRVLEVLEDAKSIFCIQVLNQGQDNEQTLGKIDPVWTWCFLNRNGLMQADGEGYYDATGLILEVE